MGMNIRIRWKESATSTDMSDVIRFCRESGYRLFTFGPHHGWLIYTNNLKEREND
jgi:hypothetical protein